VSTVAPLQPLALLRRRLTFWYAATLSLILLLLGGGLYGVIHSQLAQQLDVSLRGATKELIRAARIREMEAASAHGNVVCTFRIVHSFCSTAPEARSSRTSQAPGSAPQRNARHSAGRSKRKSPPRTSTRCPCMPNGSGWARGRCSLRLPWPIK
jgi:hypothetical protein